MSSLKNIVLSCVSEHGHNTPDTSITGVPQVKKMVKVKFGVPLANILVDGELPEPLVDILVYIARDGVATSDIFRRPGSHSDLKVIVRHLSEGNIVHLPEYNFYTLASVIKMFLLKIPGGLFGAEVERNLLNVLELNSRFEQCDAIYRIVAMLPLATQHLVALLFGTWFRVINHCEYNAMTSEAMAKSVAGSIFHTCATEPALVNDAVRLIRIIIDNFGAAGVLGRPNVQYFTERTSTAIRVREKYKYQLTGICPVGPTSSAGETSNLTQSECIDECHPMFTRVVTADAQYRGVDPIHDAVGENEFYGSRLLSTYSTSCRSGQMPEEFITIELSRPVQSCNPDVSISSDSSTHQNSHPKLAHLSSLSAPDVNEGCLDSKKRTCELSTPSKTAASYVSASLNRVDSVRRRQLSRMRKRSAWFLSPPSSGAADHSSDVSQNRSWQSGVTGVHCNASLDGGNCSMSEGVEVNFEQAGHLPQLCVNDSTNEPSASSSQLVHVANVRNNDRSCHLNSTCDRSSSSAVAFSVFTADHLPSPSHSQSSAECIPTIVDSTRRQSSAGENSSLQQHLFSTPIDGCKSSVESASGNGSRLAIRVGGSTSGQFTADSATQLLSMSGRCPPESADGLASKVIEADHSPKSSSADACYFVVDRFYGQLLGKTNGGSF